MQGGGGDGSLGATLISTEHGAGAGAWSVDAGHWAMPWKILSLTPPTSLCLPFTVTQVAFLYQTSICLGASALGTESSPNREPRPALPALSCGDAGCFKCHTMGKSLRQESVFLSGREVPRGPGGLGQLAACVPVSPRWRHPRTKNEVPQGCVPSSGTPGWGSGRPRCLRGEGLLGVSGERLQLPLQMPGSLSPGTGGRVSAFGRLLLSP